MAKARLRADARRNTDKLRVAALMVFQEKGLHAPSTRSPGGPA
ncbi:hypothetical protein [Phytohabitans suffuscus]|nr:hypothetical protein [Phytohabitans suffuscus]